MAYREVGMVQVREIVRRWLAGDGLRSIARALGIDRKTVAEYVRLAHAAGIARGGALPSEAQIGALAAGRRPGRPAATTDPSAEVRALVAHQETIRRWLSEDALRLTKVYRRLRAQGVAVSYSTLYRFARAQCDFTPAAVTVRVADPPAGARFGPSWAGRSEHRGHPDRAIVVADIGIVTTGMGPRGHPAGRASSSRRMAGA